MSLPLWTIFISLTDSNILEFFSMSANNSGIDLNLIPEYEPFLKYMLLFLSAYLSKDL